MLEANFEDNDLELFINFFILLQLHKQNKIKQEKVSDFKDELVDSYTLL